MFNTYTGQILSNLAKQSIGYEYLVERIYNDATFTSFPPFNSYTKDNFYFIEFALSGYSRDCLKVYTSDGNLVVEASKPDAEKDIAYVHNGIARRAFKWVRALADNVNVKSVNFNDGLLKIELERIVPESHRRRDYL